MTLIEKKARVFDLLKQRASIENDIQVLQAEVHEEEMKGKE